MNTYFIVVQADTDANNMLTDSAIFSNDDGNTELYINAEEAREAIARDAESAADAISELGFNGSYNQVEVDSVCKSGFIEAIIKGIEPEDGQFLWLSFGDGSQRTYTVKKVTI